MGKVYYGSHDLSKTTGKVAKPFDKANVCEGPMNGATNPVPLTEAVPKVAG